jgi:hypothetical protein
VAHRHDQHGQRQRQRRDGRGRQVTAGTPLNPVTGPVGKKGGATPDGYWGWLQALRRHFRDGLRLLEGGEPLPGRGAARRRPAGRDGGAGGGAAAGAGGARSCWRAPTPACGSRRRPWPGRQKWAAGPRAGVLLAALERAAAVLTVRCGPFLAGAPPCHGGRYAEPETREG